MKGTIPRFVTLAFCIIFSLGSFAAADTLEMKDGRVIQGKYVGGTRANLRFEVDGVVKLFPVAEVLALTFTEEAPPPAQPAKQPAQAAPPAAAPLPPAPPAAPRAATGTVTVPAGTRVRVRMMDGIDSETNKPGDRFRASLEEDLLLDDALVAAKGTEVEGRLTEVQEGGRLAGKSELKLELTGIRILDQVRPISTGEYEVAGESRGGDTAKKVGIGAAVGAVVGAIAAGGKGAAIGAGVGAGAGTAIQIFTRGEQVRVPSETVLEFVLEQPLSVRFPAARSRTR